MRNANRALAAAVVPAAESARRAVAPAKSAGLPVARKGRSERHTNGRVRRVSRRRDAAPRRSTHAPVARGPESCAPESPRR